MKHRFKMLLLAAEFFGTAHAQEDVETAANYPQLNERITGETDFKLRSGKKVNGENLAFFGCDW